jgi:hypothetical protein
VLPDAFRLEGSAPGSRDNANEAGKEGYGAVFAVQVHGFVSITCVVVQVLCERYISHRLQILCVPVARSGFITSYKAILSAGAKRKNCDEQLTFIVRVMCCPILPFVNCLFNRKFLFENHCSLYNSSTTDLYFS